MKNTVEITRENQPWRLKGSFAAKFKGGYKTGRKNLSIMNTARTVFENELKEFPEIPEFMKKSFKGLSGYENTEVNFKTTSEILEWIWNHTGKRIFFSSLINDSQIKRETKYLSMGRYRSWYYAYIYGYWKEREESKYFQGTFDTIYPDFSLSDFKSLVRRAGEYLSIEIIEEGKKPLYFKIGRYPDDSTGYVKMTLPEETLEEEFNKVPNLPWDIPQGKRGTLQRRPRRTMVYFGLRI